MSTNHVQWQPRNKDTSSPAHMYGVRERQRAIDEYNSWISFLKEMYDKERVLCEGDGSPS